MPAPLADPRPSATLGARLPVVRAELVAILAITALAAIVRLAYIPNGGTWERDQGSDMLMLRSILTAGRLPLYGPQATVLSEWVFHHGALFYYIMVPAAWLGNGDPRAVTAELALLNVPVIPMLWWIGRSIGGRATGLIAGLLAATSASLVFFSTFIWNPDLIVPGVVLGLFGAWQAWVTRRSQWWIVAAAGLVIAAQAHVSAGVFALPLIAVFIAYVRTSPRAERRRAVMGGLAGLALIAVVYLPVAIHEVLNGFPEIHGIVTYLVQPPGYVSASPPARLAFATIRILAWPLTGWPFYDRYPGLPIALALDLLFVVGAGAVALRLRHAKSISGEEVPTRTERHGVFLVYGCLILLIVVLGLGLRAVSELNLSMSEQYHITPDPLVLLGIAIPLGALWHARLPIAGLRFARAAAVLSVAGLVAVSAAHWPPLQPDDGGWPAARTAAGRIEAAASGTAVAVAGLDVQADVDAYRYALVYDGLTPVEPDRAGTVVLLCDHSWLGDACGGSADEEWIGANSGGRTYLLVDRFWASPDRLMSVYRLSG